MKITTVAVFFRRFEYKGLEIFVHALKIYWYLHVSLRQPKQTNKPTTTQNMILSYCSNRCKLELSHTSYFFHFYIPFVYTLGVNIYIYIISYYIILLYYNIGIDELVQQVKELELQLRKERTAKAEEMAKATSVARERSSSSLSSSPRTPRTPLRLNYTNIGTTSMNVHPIHVNT